MLAQVKSVPSAGRATKHETETKGDGPRKRKNSDSRKAEPEYTTEQMEAVRKIKKYILFFSKS